MRAPAIVAIAVTAVISISGCGQTVAVQSSTSRPSQIGLYDSIAAVGGKDVLAGWRCHLTKARAATNCAGVVSTQGAHGFTDHNLGVVTPYIETFINPEDGWILGPPSLRCQVACGTEVLGTTDGGSTWKQAYRTASWSVQKAVFVTPTRGYAIGNAGQTGVNANPPSLYVTADGGRSWAPEGSGGYAPQSMSFPDPQHGWMVGTKCTSTTCQIAVLASTDGGATWSVVHQVGQMSATASYNDFLVDFVTDQTGWIMVGDGAGCNQNSCFGSLYRTTDGGGSWLQLEPSGYWPDQAKLKAAGVPPGMPMALNFVTAQVGWIPVNSGYGIGTGGIERTVNGGKTWKRIEVGHKWSVFSLAADAHGATAIVSIIATNGLRVTKQELVHISPSGKISIHALPL